MKRIYRLLLCLLLIASMAISVCAANAVPKQVMNATESVVRVLAKYSDGYATGSGFVIKSNKDETLIATNYHVVEGKPYDISVWISEEETISATIVAFTNQKDICILKLAYPVSLKPLLFSANGAKQGEAVYAVGFPSAADYLSDKDAHTSTDATITDGIVSAVREATVSNYGTPTKILQINAAINSGNSGGPLFNVDGEVIGINTYGIDGSQGIFGAIDVSELESFLMDNAISISKATPSVNWWILFILAGIISIIIVTIWRKIMKLSKKTIMKSIPLRDYMKQHPDGISSNNAAAMLLPVALQLRDMHNNGLTHLEVSPDSIFVGESGAFLNAATTVETNRYTNGYAAPEIYKGLSAGNLSDIYSFCAVLSFVASGKHPMNALSRTETQKGEVIHQDVEWLELIQKGMSLDFSNRFSTMQEVIIKLSPYNVRPFIGTELREEQGAPKQHEKQRTKLSRKIMVISAVGVLVAMIVGTYIGCYCAARTKAKNGDFDAANDLLFAQELTKLHDAKLVSYIEAGQLLSMRNYIDAKVVFEELSGYLDADDLVKEADYRFAIQCADANDFTNAVTIMEYLSKIAYKDSSDKLLDIQYRSGVYLLQEKSDFKAASKIFSQLANKGYDGAEEMENQTQYLWAFDLVEREYYTDAYRKFMSIRNYEDVDECIDALSELMYLEGQNLYNKSDFSKARELFSCISSYRDSKKYITLMDNQGVLALLHPESAVKELVSIFYFENAAQLLLSRDDIAEEFLRGTWKGDGYYFTMDEEGGISYSLPWINYGDYYKISEGIVLLYPRNKEYDTKKLFFIEALSPDCIEVYCYKNNRTYTLYRE